MKTQKYPVYIVGAGPGDPDLITVKGMKILRQADVVIYDCLVNVDLRKYVSAAAEKICADHLGKKRYSDGFLQRVELIKKIMVKKAKEGKKVVRLKNGDPMIFSRFSEEVSALVKNKIEFRVVPGITAANAAAAYAGIPFTARGISSVMGITTGHEAPKKDGGVVDWNILARLDTLAIYMGMENLSEVMAKLLTAGKKPETPVAVISAATTINQKVVFGNLFDIEKKCRNSGLTSPAVIIVGEVVKKSREFNWFAQTKKFIYTGLSEERFFEKEIFFHLPLIAIKPLSDYRHLKKLIKNISDFDWIVFTSRFGVKYFFEQLLANRQDGRILAGIKIAAIGHSTANRLKEYGIIPDLVPGTETSSGLLAEFQKISPAAGFVPPKVLLPRADIADKGLADGLKKLGFSVYPVVVYKNVLPRKLPLLDLKNQKAITGVIFSSPSTVRNFVRKYGLPPKSMKIRTIGPVTEKAWQRLKGGKQ